MKTKILFIGARDTIDAYTDTETLNTYEIVYCDLGTSDEDIIAVAKNAEIIIADSIAPISENLINGMPDLKMIHVTGVGFQGVDLNAASARRIPVANSKGINAKAVAEHAVMLMIGLLRDVKNGDIAVRGGRQLEVKTGYMSRGDLRELGECTVGLVGFGDIGKALTGFLNAFGTKVLYFDTFRAPEEVEQEYGVTYYPLEELLPKCDIVSIHVPLFDSTRNMANAEFFAKMPKGSYFINTARGELANSKDLLAAIESGQLAGAGLDTIPGEPITADNEIFSASEEVEKKLLLSPHIAGVTGTTFHRGFQVVWSDVEKFLKGEPMQHTVNRW